MSLYQVTLSRRSRRSSSCPPPHQNSHIILWNIAQGVKSSAAVLRFESKQQLVSLPAGFIAVEAWPPSPSQARGLGRGCRRGVVSTPLSSQGAWRRSLRTSATAGSNNDAVISVAAAAAVAALAKTIIRTDRA